MVVDTSLPLRDIAEQYKNKNADEMLADLNQIPFFMTEFKEGDEENPQIEALRALAYDGEPDEIAENFKAQGNDCFKTKKFKDAIQFYTQALDQKCGKNDIDIACLGNRAQCNLELKNYRRCITDCSRVLDIDSSNIKAWFRSSKAFYLLDKMDECIACCDRGLQVDSENKQIKDLREDAIKRKHKLEELEAARIKKQELAAKKKAVLKEAADERQLEFRYSIQNQDNYKAVELKLEDSLDPKSTLHFPVLALYPLNMESDIMQDVDENVTIEDILVHLFSTPPAWANNDYSPENLDVFVQTSSGGLARAGVNTTLGRVFSAKGVVLIDNMARIYVVPKQSVKGWISQWDKQAQSKLVRE
ncbi:HSP70/90 family co-chaperone [Starmerella bacillaris]|uniref:HSP70/90 family co-chaperone n=1 Tax=Starmerella bacillaris TaxID=1247836 RepID=A0AAV5RLV6_STABA|nr:HSP70/90 family co-chaperone [Starmerella bacillaris]